jgi:exopolysaccharide production protein ExoY
MVEYSVISSRYGSGRGSSYRGIAKRLLDLVLVAMALPFAAPLMFFIAVLIKMADNGSVFYRHQRIGRFERAFDCLKFRTMIEDGEKVLEEHLRHNPDAQEEWNETRKLRNDPRILPGIGSFLRKTSLDELPQLLNVLRGEMSLVGPRPIVQQELAYYGRHAVLYVSVRPGITGLWQISGRSDTTYEERVRLDAEYVRTCSIRADLSILLRTAFVVARGQGAY